VIERLHVFTDGLASLLQGQELSELDLHNAGWNVMRFERFTELSPKDTVSSGLHG